MLYTVQANTAPYLSGYDACMNLLKSYAQFAIYNVHYYKAAKNNRAYVIFHTPCANFFFVFFSGFKRKHMFITTCIEKQCARPLSYLQKRLAYSFSPAYCFIF